MPFRKPILPGVGYREEVTGGSGVSEVQEAFCTTIVTIHGNGSPAFSSLIKS
jgi:hypothetical protein